MTTPPATDVAGRLAIASPWPPQLLAALTPERDDPIIEGAGELAEDDLLEDDRIEDAAISVTQPAPQPGAQASARFPFGMALSATAHYAAVLLLLTAVAPRLMDAAAVSADAVSVDFVTESAVGEPAGAAPAEEAPAPAETSVDDSGPALVLAHEPDAKDRSPEPGANAPEHKPDEPPNSGAEEKILEATRPDAASLDTTEPDTAIEPPQKALDPSPAADAAPVALQQAHEPVPPLNGPASETPDAAAPPEPSPIPPEVSRPGSKTAPLAPREESQFATPESLAATPERGPVLPAVPHAEPKVDLPPPVENPSIVPNLPGQADRKPKNPAEDVRPKTPERRAAPAPQVKPASRVAPPSPTRKSAQERPHKPTGDGRAAAPARKAQTDGSGKSPATSGKSATPGQRAPAGRASGNSNGAGQAGKASAAVSAYPGLVQRRIQRSAANQGVGASGTVSIALTIAANGGVSGVRIAKPSGNPAMDQAALRAVRRAAPFPAIPKDAGRSTWSFVVPVIFSQR